VIAELERWVTAHRDEAVREWAEWIRRPSVSSDGTGFPPPPTTARTRRAGEPGQAVSDPLRVNVESSDRFYARLIELGRTVRYERIEGAGHDIGLTRDETESVVCDWLAENLLH
jgi:hypothetical protein